MYLSLINQLKNPRGSTTVITVICLLVLDTNRLPDILEYSIFFVACVSLFVFVLLTCVIIMINNICWYPIPTDKQNFMRLEPFVVGDYVHVYNRGIRKLNIVLDEKDSWRFMQGLRFFNDVNLSQNILRNVLEQQSKSLLVSNTNNNTNNTNKLPESVFEVGWPSDWPKREPLVKIICYCLVPNHFHLLLKEIIKGGISKFMQKLGIGFTNYSNLRHQQSGHLFQGRYKRKTIDDDQIYLQYLSVYIQVINVLELFPGGLAKALENIDEALKFVEKYSFSSYQDFIGFRKSLIIDKDVLGEIFSTPAEYKKFVRDAVEGKKYQVLDLTDME